MKKGLIFVCVSAFVSALLLGFVPLAQADGQPAVVLNDTDTLVTVNINLADAETIASVLTGVGVERAKAIVAYREQHGRFYLAEELKWTPSLTQ